MFYYKKIKKNQKKFKIKIKMIKGLFIPVEGVMLPNVFQPS